MTTQNADKLVELLVKMVKLQRLLKVATREQEELIWSKAIGVVDELVERFGATRTWCEALLTFGGQYYAQKTKVYVGDSMAESEVRNLLREEVYRQEGLAAFLGANKEEGGVLE
jgi:hypothetical protein